MDWDKIDEQYGNNNFKDFAPEGKYETTVEDVEVKNVGENGATVIDFKFAENDDYKFPFAAGHWISWKNDNFRGHHNRALMMVLGASKEAAQKAVETCESKADNEKKAKAYEAMYKKLVAKHPKVGVVVRKQVDKNGNFVRKVSKTGNSYYATETEFSDPSVYMGNKVNSATEKEVNVIDAVGVEDGDPISVDDIPF